MGLSLFRPLAAFCPDAPAFPFGRTSGQRPNRARLDLIQRSTLCMHVSRHGSKPMPVWLVGEFTTHVRTYFSGWIGSRSLGVLPWALIPMAMYAAWPTWPASGFGRRRARSAWPSCSGSRWSGAPWRPTARTCGSCTRCWALWPDTSFFFRGRARGVFGLLVLLFFGGGCQFLVFFCFLPEFFLGNSSQQVLGVCAPYSLPVCSFFYF